MGESVACCQGIMSRVCGSDSSTPYKNMSRYPKTQVKRITCFQLSWEMPTLGAPWWESTGCIQVIRWYLLSLPPILGFFFWCPPPTQLPLLHRPCPSLSTMETAKEWEYLHSVIDQGIYFKCMHTNACSTMFLKNFIPNCMMLSIVKGFPGLEWRKGASRIIYNSNKTLFLCYKVIQ